MYMRSVNLYVGFQQWSMLTTARSTNIIMTVINITVTQLIIHKLYLYFIDQTLVFVYIYRAYIIRSDIFPCSLSFVSSASFLSQ